VNRARSGISRSGNPRHPEILKLCVAKSNPSPSECLSRAPAAQVPRLAQTVDSLGSAPCHSQL